MNLGIAITAAPRRQPTLDSSIASLRAIAVGLPKSGTHTIHHALAASGLNAWRYRAPGGARLATLLRQGHRQTGDPLAYLAGCEAITDALLSRHYWACLDYEMLTALRRHHPQALIILNTREPHAWLSSVNRWKPDFRDRIIEADFPGLLAGCGGKDKDMLIFQQAHYKRLRALFAGDRYFVEVAIENPDTPRTIGQALGLELGWWGVANRNTKNPAPEAHHG